MCSTTSEPNEWDCFVTKIGLLTLAAGLLEAAIMAMHCTATGKFEDELKSRLNKTQRDARKFEAQCGKSAFHGGPAFLYKI